MGNYTIDRYSFGKIIINGKIYQRDLIIFQDRIRSNWRREQGHSLRMMDLHEVIAAGPKVLIIGTGMFGRMEILQKTMNLLKSLNIEVVEGKTETACQIFNQRQVEGNVIAALHLTC